MDSRFIPVAMLAGALALAGCGGGSSTTAAGTGDAMTCGDDEMLVGGECVAKMVDDGDETETFEALRVSGADLGSSEDRINNGQIPGTGTVADRTRRVGNLAVTCPVGPQCRWRIVDGELQVTNKATGQLWSAYRVSQSPRADTTVDDGHWLSDASLIRGVGRINEGTEGEITLSRNGAPVPIRISDFAGDVQAARVNAGGSVADVNSWDAGAWTETDIETNRIPEDYDRRTELRLAHTRADQTSNFGDAGTGADGNYDYLVYGAWEQQSVQTTEGYPTRRTTGLLVAGSDPYGETPSRQLANATYKGGWLGFHKPGSGPWTETEGGITLKASFGEGLINGRIEIENRMAAWPDPAPAAHATQANAITIPDTEINSSTFGRTGLTFIGEPGRAAAEDGSWQGEFYGPIGRDGPSGIGGAFKVARPSVSVPDTSEDSEGARITIPSYAVEGAFGSTVIPESNP